MVLVGKLHSVIEDTFVVSFIGVILAPVMVTIVAPGFIMDDGRFNLASLMLRFTFPYLLFVSLTAFAGGILNTYGKFIVPAFTPVWLNISFIISSPVISVINLLRVIVSIL